ncbi:MAG TPA: SDR family oxidoreductase, partial [Pyrinomonadaceae bacterium]
MPDRETLFITGFPGLIANRLLERLARRDCRFILLVQPSLTARAAEEIARISQLTGKNDEFQVIEGDISERGLALKPADLELVQQQATRIFHLAAVYDLAVAEDL